MLPQHTATSRGRYVTIHGKKIDVYVKANHNAFPRTLPTSRLHNKKDSRKKTHPASCCWRHASNAATPYLTMKVLRKMVKNRTYLTVLLLINRRSRSPKMMGSDASR